MARAAAATCVILANRPTERIRDTHQVRLRHAPAFAERIRETAHERNLAGGEPCAALFAPQASLRVRYPFPTASRAVFTLAGQDGTGHRVHPVAVYDQHGQRLWHTDENYHDAASWDIWEVDVFNVAHHGHRHLLSADPDAAHHYQHHIRRQH